MMQSFKLKLNSILFGLFILYGLSTLLFFAPVYIDLNLIKGISFSIILFCFAISFSFFLRRYGYSLKYRSLLTYWAFSFLISCLVSILFHKQDVIYSIRTIVDFLPLFAYFFMISGGFTINQIESYFKVFIVLYLIMYSIGLLLAPTIIFDHTGGELDVNVQRGFERVKILGSGFIGLGFFMSINNYIITKRYISIFFIIVFFTLIVFSVSRQQIFFATILGLFMYINLVKIGKGLFSLLILFCILYYFILNSEIFISLIELTNQQFEATGLDNIRILAFEYYFFDYNSSFIQVLLGNGIPHYTGGTWGKEFEQISHENGYYLSDVGVAKLYFYWGLFGVILYVVLFGKIFFQKVSINFKYAKFTLMFIFFTNFASHGFFVNIFIVSMLLYLLEFDNLESKF